MTIQQTSADFVRRFPGLFFATAEVAEPSQVEAIAAALSVEARATIAACLPGDQLSKLPDARRAVIERAYPREPGGDASALAERYPDILVATCAALEPEQFVRVLRQATPELLASQSAALGAAGRRSALSRMSPRMIQALLDHTPEEVLLSSSLQALEEIQQYSTTLYKRERVRGKVQGEEVIEARLRMDPAAFFMRWVAGPFKGRRVLYNEQLLGPGKIRVREGGLLGIKAVTLSTDSPVTRRGTRHSAVELGLHYLTHKLAADFQLAGPRGHLQRRNHGVQVHQGRSLYAMESVLPRDPAHGYCCHRMIHYTDYLLSLEVKFEIFDFDDRLAEQVDYRDLDLAPRFTEADFQPRACRL